MIAIALLVVFGVLFAAMACAPLAIEELERAEEREHRSAGPVTLPASSRYASGRDHHPAAA